MMKIKIELSQIQQKIQILWQHYLLGLYRRINLHNDLLLAGGLAFSLFICIVPMILIVFSVLGHLLAYSSIQNQIDAFIITILPYQDAADYIKKIMGARIEEFTALKTVAGYIGVIGLFFAASGLFTSMRNILNIIFPSEKEEHVVIGKLRDLGMIFLVMLFFLFTMAILPLLELIIHLASKVALFKIFHFEFIYDVLFSLGSFVIILMLFAFVYYLIPHVKLNKKVILLSAFWAAFFWEIAKKIFGLYLVHFASLNKIYGAYVFIVVAAFWIYYSSIIFITGAEIGQLYREKNDNNQKNSL